MLLFSVAQLQAQNFEDAFNAFARQNRQSFNRFADSVNRQFAEAMVANMKSYVGALPKVRDPKPKPKTPPEVKQDDKPILLIEKPHWPSAAVVGELYDNIPTPSLERTMFLYFNLFGKCVQLPKQPFPDKLTGITPKHVSDFWIQLSECDYQGMLQACKDARGKSAFNDWAVCQLVLEMARNTYPGLYNEQAVLVVFLLNQLGLEAKVGFDDKHLFCLIALEQQVYGISYANIANHRYYTFETDPSYLAQGARPFRTYDMPFPKQTRGLDMHIRRSFNPISNTEQEIPDTVVKVNRNMIEFYNTYPQVDIEVYANAQPSKEFVQSIDKIFRPYLSTLSAYDAVEYLLTYLQYGFEYALDTDQFGYEKPFFCEEIFYYPKNDCEDRAVLFSFLVRHLLHLEVVLIDYPGHIATAVHFPMEVKGESVMYNGKRYVICDPTYLGAAIGVEMQGFTAADRTVVPL